MLDNCERIVNPTGSIAITGVYSAPDPGTNRGHDKKGIRFSIAECFDQRGTLGSGQAPVKKYNEYLRDLIVNGRAKPSQIISHRIQIEPLPMGMRNSTVELWLRRSRNSLGKTEGSVALAILAASSMRPA